jgi:hypothetical protein
LVRRKTATSWRSTRSSMSLAADVRPISRISPSTCRKIEYSNRNDTPASCPIGNHRWSATQARLVAPHRAQANISQHSDCRRIGERCSFTPAWDGRPSQGRNDLPCGGGHDRPWLLALRPAARELALDFVPLTWEPYDVVLPANALGAAHHGPAPIVWMARDNPRCVGQYGGSDRERDRRFRGQAHPLDLRVWNATRLLCRRTPTSKWFDRGQLPSRYPYGVTHGRRPQQQPQQPQQPQQRRPLGGR